MTDPRESTLVAAPGPRPRSVRTADGAVLDVPEGWELLPPGDAGLTRKVKAAGPTWTVKEKRGRREFSRGLWAPAEHIARSVEAVEATRASPAYQRKLAADRSRRERKHQEYAADFEAAVRDFLAFHPRHVDLERRLAGRVARHATPVGSGTVARTERIPVEQRARAAVIAWLRHQTTAYDRMQIKRVKGRRREVRRELARASMELLSHYRVDAEPPQPCRLWQALAEPDPEAERPRPRKAARRPAPPTPSEAPATADEHDARQRAIQERVLARLKR
jgi:hypothetical protein